MKRRIFWVRLTVFFLRLRVYKAISANFWQSASYVSIPMCIKVVNGGFPAFWLLVLGYLYQFKEFELYWGVLQFKKLKFHCKSNDFGHAETRNGAKSDRVFAVIF